MTHNTNIEKPTQNFIPSFWMYTGAFLFSTIVLILVHELGHYFAFRLQGYHDVHIRITPFFGITTSSRDIQTEDGFFIILGGTIFNLTMASLLAIHLKKIKLVYLILFKMYPVMAFLIEGMVILGGLFFDETITDFAILIELGWSPILAGFLGFIFISIGGYLSYEIWVLHGIHSESSRKRVFWLNSQYALYLFVAFLMSQILLPAELSSVQILLAICMVLHWLYLGIRILILPIISPRIEKGKMESTPLISIQSSIFSILLGAVSWVFSFLFLN